MVFQIVKDVSRCAEAVANQKQNVLAMAFGTELIFGVVHTQFDELKRKCRI